MKIIMPLVLALVLGLAACSGSSSGALAGVFTGPVAGDKIELNEDGSCHVVQDGQEFRGTYQNTNGAIVMNLGISKSMELRLEGEQLRDGHGGVWSRH